MEDAFFSFDKSLSFAPQAEAQRVEETLVKRGMDALDAADLVNRCVSSSIGGMDDYTGEMNSSQHVQSDVRFVAVLRLFLHNIRRVPCDV